MIVLLTAAAFAQRPTSGGMYSFDAMDVVQSWEEPTGRVRVHFSVEGPNVTRLTDDDLDGVPDFAQEVALTAAEVLDFYETDLGLRPPIGEEEMGLSELGGSFAFDFYLVDFGGDADGLFGVDKCVSAPNHCSGYMVMENDFKGYGYPSLSEAIRVLTSHELFHAVQAAYDAEQPVWFSEGTAVWGEQQFDPDSLDFRWFADEYLADCGRSLDRPPTGPVPAFAYSTALFWDFLTLRHDPALMHELLLGTESLDGVAADTTAEVEIAVEGRGDTLEAAWTTFVSWNLATGDRAGAMDGYPYADELDGVAAELEGDAIDDDNRFYPLAATYYRLDHAGGELWFGVETDASALRFALHPVAGGDEDGPVSAAVAAWDGAAGPAWVVGDLAEGGYWLVGTYPAIAQESTKVRFCLGDQATAELCAPLPEDTGDTDTGGEEPGGCGCDGTGGGVIGWAVALGLVVRRRRNKDAERSE